MEQLLISTLTVTLAEIGDKTQLLSLFLILKYRRPIQIALGILIATIVNHLATAYFGVMLSSFFDSQYLQYIISGSFIALALWLLVPDEDEPVSSQFDKYGVLLATTILFFIAELGDKTQVATALLASQYNSIWIVTLGSTLGMLAANLPVLAFGEKLLQILPMKFFRWLAAFTAFSVGIAGFLL